MSEIFVRDRAVIRKGRVFDFTVEKVVLPNNHEVDLEIIRHPGAAAIVALDSRDRILMLQQYRHAIGSMWWEIPAGTLEKGEDPQSCAQRELTEETGYRASTWEYLGATTPVPGYSDERIHLYLARQLSLAQQQLDVDEIVQVHSMPIKEVVMMILQGRIEDAKTVSAIFLALPRIGYTSLTGMSSGNPR